MNTQLGIIGLGNLGLALAKNLLQTGFRVSGYRRSSMDEFIKLGGKAAISPANLAEENAIIITCLPSSAALHEVCFGEQGLIKSISANTILIEMSTLAINEKQTIASQLQAHQVEMLDCPVSASVEMVAQRQGMLFASGNADTYEKITHVLDAILDRHAYVGEFGLGTKIKLTANLLVAINNVAVAEAMCFARKAGLDPEKTVELLKNSGGGSRQFDTRAPMMAAEKYLPANGSVNAITEVVKLIDQQATENDCAIPLLRQCLSYYQQAIDTGRGEQDMACMHALMMNNTEKL